MTDKMTLCDDCGTETKSKRYLECVCGRIFHLACIHLSKLATGDIDRITWRCTHCLKRSSKLESENKQLKEKIADLEAKLAEKNEIKDKLNELAKSVDSVSEVLNKVEKNVSQPFPPPSSSSTPSFPSPPTYAGVARKHLLVIKSTEVNKKASENKDEISKVLDGLQIVDTKFQQSGNVVLNFKSDKERDEAAVKMGDLENLFTTKTKLLDPRIMICNVSNEENKDDLVETIIARNDYLKSIDDVTSKISLTFEKNAAGATKHYILRCHPEVRKMIYNKGDQIKLEWGVYKVRARYFATMCYHCLNYGHVQSKCPVKDTEDPCCKKCAGKHSFINCSSNEKKCFNCVRAGKKDINHSSSEMCCPVLNAEIDKIRNRTDHGY